MLLFVFVFFLIRDSETCIPVEKQHKFDTAPTLAISTIEFPDEHVLPVGSNVTIICTSNSSKEDYDNPYNVQPYWMQFYFNHGVPFIKECGGRSGDGVDNEDSKVCTFFIENATKSDSGIYKCRSYNQMSCTQGTIQLDFQVLRKPIFTTHPKSKAVDLNNGFAMVTLQCAAEGLPPPVITWLKNNSTVVKEIAIQNGSVSSLDLAFQEISTDDLKYRCLATNSAGKTLSQEATLTIEENSTASTDSLSKGNIAASSTNSLPEFMWPLVGVVVVTILSLLIIFIVMKQKWLNRANSQHNWEMEEQRYFNLYVNEDAISQQLNISKSCAAPRHQMKNMATNNAA